MSNNYEFTRNLFLSIQNQRNNMNFAFNIEISLPSKKLKNFMIEDFFGSKVLLGNLFS